MARNYGEREPGNFKPSFERKSFEKANIPPALASDCTDPENSIPLIKEYTLNYKGVNIMT